MKSLSSTASYCLCRCTPCAGSYTIIECGTGVDDKHDTVLLPMLNLIKSDGEKVPRLALSAAHVLRCDWKHLKVTIVVVCGLDETSIAVGSILSTIRGSDAMVQYGQEHDRHMLAFFTLSIRDDLDYLPVVCRGDVDALVRAPEGTTDAEKACSELDRTLGITCHWASQDFISQSWRQVDARWQLLSCMSPRGAGEGPWRRTPSPWQLIIRDDDGEVCPKVQPSPPGNTPLRQRSPMRGGVAPVRV